MTLSPSIEFWIAILFVFNFLVVIFLFLNVKRINRLHQEIGSSHFRENTKDAAVYDPSEHAVKITNLLEPLVEESRQTAVRFDSQIKEKKRLIKELNEALDSRIISINLLLSRADAQQRKLEDRQDRLQQQQTFSPEYRPENQSDRIQADDQQNQILSLYYQNVDIDTIARKLSIPKGEVRLVVDLKEKFVAMEQDSP